MAEINGVLQTELVEKAAEKLKSNSHIKPPAWAFVVKTGVSKERPPARSDWWYVRAAAVLLKVYKQGPIGVSKLRTLYGAKKNRGVKPEHFYKGSGNVIRKVLQQLESAGFAKQMEKGLHKGRIITKEGKLFLEQAAKDAKANPKLQKKRAALPEQKAEERPQSVPVQQKKRDASIPKAKKSGE